VLEGDLPVCFITPKLGTEKRWSVSRSVHTRLSPVDVLHLRTTSFKQTQPESSDPEDLEARRRASPTRRYSLDIIFAVAALFGAIHFATPLAYYMHLRRYLRRSWNLQLDSSYIPKTTVMIPTFNESGLIEARLDNIKMQLFPKEKLDVIVIDSGSTDGTAERVKSWSTENPDLKITLIREPVRKGKAQALNSGLGQATGDVVVMTDADARWDKVSLRNAVSYFSDTKVGAVTGIKEPIFQSGGGKSIELAYRRSYNAVRIAESKIHSTPIFNGELSAFKKDLLDEIGGFQTSIGADDSHAAALVSLSGFRSIAVPDVPVFEFAPNSWFGYVKWKKRRALHLIQHFKAIARRIRAAPPRFRSILEIEIFLHVLNPWFLVAAVASFAASVLTMGFSLYHLTLILSLGATQFAGGSRKALRTWVVDQLILVYASVSGLFSSELVWPKIQELRTPTKSETSDDTTKIPAY